MARRIDPTIHNTVIDANVLDHLGDEDDVAFETMQALHESLKIILVLPYSVLAELDHPNTPSTVKARSKNFIFTEPVSLTPGERSRLDEVVRLIRGNAQLGQHDRDAFHVWEASKYGAGYFVTKDKRLLRKAVEVGAMLQLVIESPTNFVTILNEFLDEDM